MSNSPLINYTKISPNKTTPRDAKIDTITIHHVAGDCSIEVLGDIFAPTSREASSNYGIGSDGRIGMYVEEKDRAWTSSNRANDMRSITIEVSNNGGADQGWPISDTALTSLIKLISDICQRNNIKILLWKNDKKLIGQIDKQNLTLHQWFKQTSCPGPYLVGKMGYIVTEVNKLLGAEQTPSPSKPVYFEPYLIKITASALNIRSGPGTNTKILRTLVNDPNTYTIVEEDNGPGAKKWGRLKSGAGWIALTYTKKV